MSPWATRTLPSNVHDDVVARDLDPQRRPVGARAEVLAGDTRAQVERPVRRVDSHARVGGVDALDDPAPR